LKEGRENIEQQQSQIEVNSGIPPTGQQKIRDHILKKGIWQRQWHKIGRLPSTYPQADTHMGKEL
jgi:hypothetical protein